MKVYQQLFFFVSLILLSNTGNTQILKWAGTFENAKGSSVSDLKTDKLGGVYTLINTSDSVDLSVNPTNLWLPPVSTQGAGEFVIVKHDSAGAYQFHLRTTGNGATPFVTEIAVSELGAIYSLGFFRARTDFDPGTGTHFITPSSVSGADHYLQAFDDKGKFKWVKTFEFNGTNGLELRSIDVDKLGNVYVTGHFAGTMNFDLSTAGTTFTSKGSSDGVILKYSKQGNFLWVKTFGGTGLEQILDVEVSANSIYLSGLFRGNSDFDPSSSSAILNAGTRRDAFISKLDHQGNFLWAKNYGDDFLLVPYHITSDAKDNAYVLGQFSNRLDLDPGSGIFIVGSTTNGLSSYVAKFNANGTFHWGGSISSQNSNFPYDIESEDDLIFITTEYYNETTIQTSKDTVKFGSDSYANGMSHLTAIDENGAIVWSYQLQDTLTYTSATSQISIGSKKEIYFTGPIAKKADVDFSSKQKILHAFVPFETTHFLARYNPCAAASVPSLVQSQYDVCKNSPLQLTVTGSLNDNEYWSIKRGSVDSITIDTSRNGVFQLNPAQSDWYYVLGEGGCARNAPIDSFMVTLLETDFYDTIVKCNNDSVLFAGQMISKIGWYVDTLVSSSTTCDSIIHLYLDSSIIDTGITPFSSYLESNETKGSYTWYHCDATIWTLALNGNSRTFQFQKNGGYSVVVNKNNCSDTSSCFQVTTVEIEEINEQELTPRVYPNPSTGGLLNLTNFKHFDHLTVHCIGSGKNIQYNLLNMKEGDKTEIQLDPGTYLFRFLNDENHSTIKVIVL